MSRARVIAVVLGCAIFAAACGGADGTPPDAGEAAPSGEAEPAAPEVVTVAVTDKEVNFVDSLESEPVTITLDLQSKNKDAGFIGIGRVNEGVDPQEAADNFGNDRKVFDLITVAGGISPPEKEVTVLLPEGDYVIGAPDVGDKGLATVFKVGPATGGPVQEPETDVTVETGDFYFKVDGEIGVEPTTVLITNTGEQPHMVGITQGRDEAGFALAPAPGGKVWTTFDLKKAGRYDLMCFFEDPKSGKPHFKLGMRGKLVVKK